MLVLVKDQPSGKRAGILPFTRATIYKLHSELKHPNLIYKVAGQLVFDLGEWERMAVEAKELSIKAAAKKRRGLDDRGA